MGTKRLYTHIPAYCGAEKKQSNCYMNALNHDARVKSIAATAGH